MDSDLGFFETGALVGHILVEVLKPLSSMPSQSARRAHFRSVERFVVAPLTAKQQQAHGIMKISCLVSFATRLSPLLCGRQGYDSS